MAHLACGRADAANRYWTGAGTWNLTNANWGTATGGPYTSTWSNSAPDAAIFEGTAGTVTLTMTATTGGMTFNTTGYTVTGGSITRGGVWSIATGLTGTIASLITGPSTTIFKTGAGVLRLTNTGNNFSGQITLANGMLEMAAIPSSSFLIAFQGGTLRYIGTTNRSTSRPIEIRSSVARLESSGAGTINFSSSAIVSSSGLTSAGATLQLGGTNTGNNFWRGRLDDFDAGPAAMTKADAGTWIITGSSGYTGGTIISGGTLGFGSTAALGTGTVTFSTSATLQATVSGTLSNSMSTGTSSAVTATVDTQASEVTLSGTIDGAGDLTKIGTGTLSLTADSTHTGATTVSVGRLSVNGSLGNTAVTVSSAAELGGSGSITGPISILAGGTLAPGNSIDSLAGGATSFAAGATFGYEVDSSLLGSLGTAADLLVVNGNLDIASGSLLSFTDITSGSVQPFLDDATVFAMINYSGTWNGGLFTFNGTALADGEKFSVGSQQWQIDYDYTYNTASPSTIRPLNYQGDYVPSSGTQKFVAITAVPEPSTWAMGLAGIACGGWVTLHLRRRA